MNSAENDIPFGVTPEAERLICRSLDGEITVAEQARLDQILAGSDAARALFAEYRVTDALAVKSMRQELASGARCLPDVIPFRQRLRPVMVAAAGAALSAAAVVAISVLMNPSPRAPQIVRRPVIDAPIEARFVPPAALVDYRDGDHQPRQRYGNVYRDLIGIRGSDPNRIYIFERESQATRSIPVSSDF